MLFWAALFKADDVAQVVHVQRWVSSVRCARWIRQHKSTSLLGTELFNYGTHGLDPLGVTFALGGTLVNVLVIYFLMPWIERHLQRGRPGSTQITRLTNEVI
jgi:predicted Co/Zn/Cd cation transporter (cation efflux family)